MGLPTSRDITLNPGDPIPSALLNKLQDGEIGFKRPSLWTWRIPVGRSASEVNISWAGGTATANPGPGQLDMISVEPIVGDRITTIGARVLGTGAGLAVVVHFYRNNGDGTTTLLATLNIATPPAVWTLYTVDLAPAEVVADQKSYYFEVELPTTNQAIAMVGYASDRL